MQFVIIGLDGTDSDAALKDYLKTEPYVSGDVWRTIDVHKSNTREPWQFNHSQEWFESRED